MFLVMNMLAQEMQSKTNLMKKVLFLIVMSLFLSNCATTSGPSGSGIVGNNLSTTVSKDEMRKINQTINYTENLPENAEVISTITVRRCHRNVQDPVPSEATLKNDLKIAAYEKGGDGFTNYEMKKISGGIALLYNCWQLRDASATIYKLK